MNGYVLGLKQKNNRCTEECIVKLHHQIFAAIVLAAIVGVILPEDSHIVNLQLLALFDGIGKIFLNALKMLVVPLIVTAIMSSLNSVGKEDNLGRTGWKIGLFYVLSSALAVTIGLMITNLIRPGISHGEPVREQLGLVADPTVVLEKVQDHAASDFAQIFFQFLPPNLFEAAAQEQMLGLIMFSLLFGFYMQKVGGDAGKYLRHTIDGIYETMVSITMLVIRFTPIGVFGLIASTVMRTGFSALVPLLWFFITVLLALAVHAFVALPLAIRLVAKRSPWRLLKAVTPALLTAFSTSSSSATLPLTMECTERGARVPKKFTSLMLPLGATVNMNGTALYECAAVIFIAQAYGLDLSLGMQITIVFTAMITSIGVAGIPAASLVAITLILGIVGLPAEAIGLILVTDRILDMCRTSVNIWGDVVGTVLIARSEGVEEILQPIEEHKS